MMQQSTTFTTIFRVKNCHFHYDIILKSERNSAIADMQLGQMYELALRVTSRNDPLMYIFIL
jgi:hypothetical protein